MDPENFSFCPTLQELLRKNYTTGKTGRRFEGLTGFSSRNTLYILQQLSIARNVKNTLEVGLACGGSALTLLSTLRDIWGDAPHSHTAIDPFQESTWDNSAIAAVEHAGLEDHFEHIPAESCSALARLLQEGRRYDLIYIDGSHLFEDVFVDMFYACRLLPRNGIVVFDDCSDRHVRKVIGFVRKNYTDIIQEFDLSPYRRSKTWKYRIGRLVGRQQIRAFVKTGDGPRRWNSRFHQF